MKFWRSVVVKLWFTILLLVAFVLFFVSVMIMQFLQNYSASENEKDLKARAEKIAEIIDSHELSSGLEISWELIDDVTGLTIVISPTEYYTAENEGKTLKLPLSYFLENEDLSQVLEAKEPKRKYFKPASVDHAFDLLKAAITYKQRDVNSIPR